MTGSDEYLDRVRAGIVEFGWMIQHVGATSIDETPWSYTVGLAEKKLPELIIVGPLHHEVSHEILNTAAKMMRDKGAFTPGEPIHELANVAFVAITVTDVLGEHFAIARRIQGGATLTLAGALQLVWPDSAGRFPWDEGASNVDAQPLLGSRPTPEV